MIMSTESTVIGMLRSSMSRSKHPLLFWNDFLYDIPGIPVRRLYPLELIDPILER